MNIAVAVWQFLRPFLVFRIALPVWVFLVIGAWLWIDKTSDIRTAVNTYAAELIAGAKLDALEAQLIEERRIRVWSDAKAAEASRIADAERAARVDLEITLTLTDTKRKGLADELAAIKAHPVSGNCTVDQFLLDRLRNK
ncbi:hypothetical protein [Mesorhizobium sp.]|uniref:hypothetical protein n=1 Tax=Mesorhizobium sp. TaxID=1871066 RepID=UPI000FE631EB|nr:hypothetical protein [Mesorhizobium sp.]RWP69558.1 MAG: hypothetical protein EOR07_03265 [Mesorhizobium sp.]